MDAVSSQRKRVLIVGASETGISLARMLCTTFEVAVLESNPARLEPLREVQIPEARLNLLAKDGTSLLNLKDAGVEGAEWVIALTERDEANALLDSLPADKAWIELTHALLASNEFLLRL